MLSEPTISLIKSRIRIFVGIVLAAVVAISAWSIVTEYRNTITTAERQASGYAQALSEHTESSFAEADRVVKDVIHEIGRAGGIRHMPQRELYDILQRQGGGAPQIGSLFMADASGLMFINSLAFPSRQINVADREYYRHYRENPGAGLYISKPVMSRLVGRWRFNLIRPLLGPDKEFAGLMAVAFEVEYFKRFFSESSLGPRGRVLLIRDDGAPLVFVPYVDRAYEADFRSSQLFRTWLPKAATGTFHLEKGLLDKTPHIVSYKRLNRFPIIAVVSLHRDDVLKPWSRKAYLQVAVTFALCTVICVLTLLMFRHLDRLESAQDGLRRQQELLRIKAAQIDAANDAILQVDLTGRLVHFNQALCRITGYSAEELTGIRLHDIVHAEFAGQIEGNLQRIREHGEATLESGYIAKDGGLIPIEANAHIMESNGEPFILSIARDVRERKRAESREQGRLSILEEMATGAGLGDLLAQIVTFVEQQCPGALCSVLLADEGGRQLLHAAAPNLPDEYNRAVHGLKIGQGMGSCGTAAHLKKRVVVEDICGHPYWKGFKPALDHGFRACWSQPILSSEGEILGTFAIYYREPRLPDDAEISLIESAAHLSSIAIGRFRDEERRKHLEDQLRQIQKIEAIGQLAGGIAHDFNNLLTPILIYSEMIKMGLPEDAPQVKKADGILKAAHKARELTQKLLSFGRRQMLDIHPVDLNEVIESFHDILRRTIRENIGIQVGLSTGRAIVMADRSQIEQILLNLAINAQDAIAGNGRITIETGQVLLDDEYARLHPGMRTGKHILLSITDTGCGMDDATLSRIFEPFFTTKGVGHGTGLGLATVYGVIKQHEGYIDVRSTVGAGTTFSIYLPVSTHPLGSGTGNEADGGIVTSTTVATNRTILVVEDNEMVRTMVVELLMAAGFRVMVAETPELALEMALAPADAIDLLVTDVIMPGMNGQELYERLLESRPHLPVLFISGYTNDLVVHNGMLEEGINFLQKPFTIEQFMAKVRLAIA